MSVCPLSKALAPLALAVALAAGVVYAGEPPPAPLVQRVYAVADLVIPLPSFNVPGVPVVPLHAPPPLPDGRPIAYAKPPMPPMMQVRYDDGPVTPAGPPVRIGVDFGFSVNPPAPAACPAPPCVPLPPPPPPPAAPPADACPKMLLNLLQNTISPHSWAERGGRGTIDYHPIGMALVVNQTAEVQAQVAELLKSLRRLQDVQVALEVRAVTVCDSFFEHAVDRFQLGRESTTLMDGPAAARFLETVQGDRRTTVLQAPKLTTFSGQEATVRAEDQQFFVTGLQTCLANNQTVFVPHNEALTTGFGLTVLPTVTPDRKSVLVKLQADFTELTDRTAPLFPVTTFITPEFEGGSQGQPIPFTQFIQQPTVLSRGVQKVMGIPDGRTALIYAGRGTQTVEDVNYAPVLGHIPYLQDLFKTVTHRQEGNHLLLMVTPRVVISGELEAAEESCTRDAKAACAECPKDCAKCPAVCGECPKACAEAKCVPEGTPCTKDCPKPCADVLKECPACPQRATPVAEVLPCPKVCPNPTTAACTSSAAVLAERQIYLRLYVLRLDEKFFAQPAGAAWADLAPKGCCAAEPKTISPGEAERFLKAVKGQGGELLSQPQIMTLDDQKAHVQIGGEQTCVTGLTLTERDGVAVPEFQTESVRTGISLGVRPKVSADGRFVRLEMSSRVSTPCPNQAEGIKVMAFVPSKDDPAKGETRTETLRRLALNVHEGETCVCLPPERTALVYLNGGTAGEHVLVLVTPRLVEPQAAVAPPAQVQFNLSLLAIEDRFFNGGAWANLSPQRCGATPTFVEESEADSFVRTVRAAQCGLLLAQPMLTCCSGRPASFLCGGQQEVPGPDGIHVEPFGKRVTILPIVRGDDRIFVEMESGCRPDARHDWQRFRSSFMTAPGRTMLFYPGPVDEAGRHVAVLATPYIIKPSTPCQPAATEESSAPPTLEELMGRYHKACAEGRPEAAKKFAAMCLALDPTCFAK